MDILLPLIWLFLIVSFLLIRLNILNRKYNKQYQMVTDRLGNLVNVNLEQVKCDNFRSGLAVPGYVFGYANLLLTEDALFIFGYSRFLSFQQHYPLLIITKDTYQYVSSFPGIRIINPDKVNLHSFNEDIYIEFYLPGIIGTHIEMRFKDIADKSNFSFLEN